METMRVKTFVERYGISRSKTYELIAAGRLATVKLDGARLILASSAQALIEKAAA